MLNKFNPFHLVELSPWPVLISQSIFVSVSSLVLFMNKKAFLLILLSLALTILVTFVWFRDIHRESSNQGHHSVSVTNGLKTGMILFITSEVLFFLSFFWAFFHMSISPSIELGQTWPPEGIYPFNPMSIPFLNTILLVSSGVSITWSHHSMLKNNYSSSKFSLAVTIMLGAIFSMFQMFEYSEAPFSISDSSFGSIFFMSTGFHGFHVLVGSIFLSVSLFRFNKIFLSKIHMVGLECASWYWHFVDVVWLFLYVSVYWWGH